MNAEDFMKELRDKGITLYLKGGNIGYHAPKFLLTEGLLERMKQYKQDIIKELRKSAEQNGDYGVIREKTFKADGEKHEDGFSAAALEEKIKACLKVLLGEEADYQKPLLPQFTGQNKSFSDFAGLVRNELGINLPLIIIKKYPTLPQLTAYIHSEYYELLDFIPAVKNMEDYELSTAQRRLWIIHKLNPYSIAYLISGAYKMTGELDIACLNRAINCLIERHESLRTVFIYKNGEPRQKILPSLSLELGVVGLEKGEDREKCLQEYISRKINQGFQLDKAPLYNFMLYRLEDNEHVLLCVIHHMLADGWSVNILIREMVELYNGFVSSSDIKLFPVLSTYKDFSEWHKKVLSSESIKKQLNYWKKQFAYPASKMEFPYDFARPSAFTFNGKNIYFKINREISGLLKIMSQKFNITLNTLFLSLYGILLHLYCELNELVIGVIVSGRNHTDLENVVGVFCNYLPFKICIYPETGFSEYAVSINRQFSEILDNQEVPYELLINEIEKDYANNRNPIFDTMLVFHNEQAGFGLDTGSTGAGFKNLDIESYFLENTGAALDFKLDLYDNDQEFLGVFQYNTDLLKPESAQGLISKFMLLMDNVIKNNDIPIGDIELFDEKEAAALLEKKSRLKKKEYDLSVVVSSTFVAEPVQETLKAWCSHFGLNADVRFAPYNQVFQQLLDPESMLAENKGIGFLLVRFEDWLRYQTEDSAMLHEKILRDNYYQLLAAVKGFRSDLPLFVGIMPVSVPENSSPGIISVLKELYAEWRRELNGSSHIHTIDFTSLGSLYGIPDVFDRHKDQAGHIPYSDSFMDAAATHMARSILAWHRHKYKVVVLDCDNTLWGGQIGEAGISGIVLSEPFIALQKFMLKQYSQGMLLTLCSKNNEDEVWEVFEQHPGMVLKKDHITEARINWNLKSENIRELAQTLNLGLDSFIFIDDNVTECLEVADNCPEVLVLPLPKEQSNFARFLEMMWGFDKLGITEEDSERSGMYKAEKERKSLSESKASLKEFLFDLNLKVSMRKPDPCHYDRISQLTQRTSQFNLNGIQRTQADIMHFHNRTDFRVWIVEAQDRFGSYGIVGTVIGRMGDSRSFIIESFLLSCRALGRGIEKVMLSGIRSFCEENGIQRLSAGYRQTARNIPLQKFICESGFFEEIHDAEQKEVGINIGAVPKEVPYIQFYYLKEYPKPSIKEARVIAESGDALSLSGEIETWGADNPFDLHVLKLLKRKIGAGRYYLPYEFYPGSAVRGITSRKTGIIRREYEHPLDEVERRLSDLWADLLNIDKVGRQEHFFRLGGNSLEATSLVSLINKIFKVGIGLNDVFENPVLKDLARLIRKGDRKTYVPIEKIKSADRYGLSQAQFRIFFIAQMNPESTSYNNTGFYRVRGDMDPDKFQEAVSTLVSRHEILRTSFELIDGIPYQRIHDDAACELRVLKEGNKSLESMAGEFIKPFRLSEAPLLRIELAVLGTDEYLLMFDIHHIISDGLSLRILVYELFDIYNGKHLPPLDIQYKDFAAWQKNQMASPAYFDKMNFWIKSYEYDIPVLNFPADFQRPAVMAERGDHWTVKVDMDVKGRMDELVQATGTTSFMVLVCAYAGLMSKYCAQEDLVIGTPVSGRTHPDIEPLIGMFVNTLALRLRPKGELSFSGFLRESEKYFIEVFKNQEVPFEDLVDHLNIHRDISRNPLFDTMFTLQTTDYSYFKNNGLEFIQYKFYKRNAQFDLSLDATETKNGIELVFEYSTELFRDGTIKRFAEHYVNFLREAVANPQKKMADIDFMDEEEKHLLLSNFGAKPLQIDKPRVFHSIFEQKAAENPKMIALICKDQRLTYEELNEKANQLAGFLKDKGAGVGERICVLMDRSPELYISILAVLKSGGVFIPVSSKTPGERVLFYLRDSEARFVLTREELAGQVEGQAEVIAVDSLLLSYFRKTNPEEVSCRNNPAYQIYTSGTTGQPKGVVVTHAQLTGIGYAWQQAYRLDEFPFCLLQIANISFDVFVGDLARSFMNGGKLVVCPDEVRLDLPELYRLIIKEQVNIFESTPQLVIPLMDYVYSNQLPLDSLRTLIVGSDIFKVEDYRRLLRRYQKRLRIINSYGVTEATIDSTYFESDLESLEDTLSGNVPIGWPFPNVRCVVLDSNMKLQPVGVPGELCIGGIGVSEGYWRREDLSRDKFFDSAELGGRWYKTGDVAVWNSMGYLEFQGRNDRQVKIRGYRIELAEIENVMLKYPGIREAIVRHAGRDINEGFLYGYIVESEPVDIAGLNSYLSGCLPEYMIPAGFMKIRAVPLTPNGKINFKEIPEPMLETRISMKVKKPGNEMEEKLLYIWKSVLEAEEISIHDNFFDIGGNSVLILRLFNQIQNRIFKDITVPDLFSYPTIALLAEYIGKMTSTGTVSAKKTEIEELLGMLENQSIDVDTAKKILKDI